MPEVQRGDLAEDVTVRAFSMEGAPTAMATRRPLPHTHSCWGKGAEPLHLATSTFPEKEASRESWGRGSNQAAASLVGVTQSHRTEVFIRKWGSAMSAAVKGQRGEYRAQAVGWDQVDLIHEAVRSIVRT